MDLIGKATPPGDADLPAALDPSPAGAPARSGTAEEFVCYGCGYRILHQRPLPRCPMCHNLDWLPVTQPTPQPRVWPARTRPAPDAVSVGSGKRETNRAIRDGVEAVAPSEPVAFLCECADASCYRTVWLTPAAYDQARADPTWQPLAPAHRRSTPAEETR